MKKTLFALALLLLVKLSAQTADFKKNYEDGNMKCRVKSFSLAIVSYDKAIATVQADADNAIQSKTYLSNDKKYISDVYAKRAMCYYNTGNFSAMKADADKVIAL